MGKRISVVIPVYNTEPNYIDKAINSVLNQTYKNIEIIVVNDGSTDKATLEYLKTINNPDIKIINQENKGLGGARNTGIENSTGEYIGFLDSDDWLDNNFYEVLYNLCEKNVADIACGILTRVFEKRQKQMDNFRNKVEFDFVEKMKYIKNGSVCSKLFKKSLFNNIRFEEKVYYEDNLVLVDALLNSNKVVFTNRVKYYYRENPVSICLNSSKEKKRANDKFYILNKICEIIEKRTQEEKDAVMYKFAPILVDAKMYNANVENKLEINRILGKNYKKYLSHVENSFLENIFSIKTSSGKTHKILTILWIKFKLKRKIKNHA